MTTTIQALRNAVDKAERDHVAACRRNKADPNADTAVIVDDAHKKLQKAEHDLAESIRGHERLDP